MATSSPAASDRMSGDLRVVSDHELLRPVASGSYGEVWLARSAVGTLRAVKIVRRDRFERAEDFDREFKGLQRFEPLSRSHEGLVDILQIGRPDDASWFYYIMELADDASTNGSSRRGNETPSGLSGAADQRLEEGMESPHVVTYSPHTLRAHLRSRGALSADEVIALGRALTAALAYLHEQGLVHRDIKPSNILFVGGVPKLADAGLVAAMDDARSMVGTAGYIAPEGPGSPKADLYALGKVLYEAAFGKDRQDFPQLPGDLATRPDHARLLELNAIIARACAHDPKQRYASSEAMLADLERLGAGKSVKRRLAWQKRAKLAGFGLGLVSVVLGGGWLFSRVRTTTDRGTKNEQAWIAYTQARHFGAQAMADKQREYFELAVKEDPQFAEAWAGLAGSRASLEEVVHHGPNAVYPSAIAAAETAIRLNPKLTEPLAVLAGIKTRYGYEQQEAANLYRRLLELEPKNPWHQLGLAHALSFLGRTSESVTLVRQAIRATPTDVLSWEQAGHILYEARLYDEAAIALQKGIELHPDNAWLRAVLRMVYEDAGRTNEATEALLTNMRLGGHKPEDIADTKARIAAHGMRGAWQFDVDEMKGSTNYVLPIVAALEYFSAGDHERCLDWLEKLPAEPYSFARLRVWPRFDPLRDHPRFKELMRRLDEEQAKANQGRTK